MKNLPFVRLASVGVAAFAFLTPPPSIKEAQAQQVIPFPTANPFRGQTAVSTPAATSAAQTQTFQSASGIPIPRPAPNRNVGSASSQQAAPTVIAPPVQTATSNSSAPQVNFATSDKGGSDAALKAVFDRVARRDGRGMIAARDRISNKLDRSIANWMIATSRADGLPLRERLEARSVLAGWPGGEAMQRRIEQDLVKAGDRSATALKLLGDEPSTDDGIILQIRALLAQGRNKEARDKARSYWIWRNFTAATEKKFLSAAGNLLQNQHHYARASRLLYDDRASGALRLTRYLNGAQTALVKARVAVVRREGNASSLLSAVPKSMRSDPGYVFSRVQHLRRADRWSDAAAVLAKAPTKQSVLIDPDEWWVERRLVSRKMREAGKHSLAYQLAANHAARGRVATVDAEFHAGWYALQLLNRPKVAIRHFDKLRAASSRKLSQSRALYWIGRSYEKMGQKGKAREFYKAAGQYQTTYYGQLALRKRGVKSLSLPRIKASGGSRSAFAKDPMVRVIKRLNEVGQVGRTGIFYRHLAKTMKDPGQLALLTALSDSKGLYPISLQIGKLATLEGVRVQRLEFPLGAISKGTKISNENKALAYAISRQESAFQINAVSSAKAMGLMQLIDATAKRTARKLGVPYSKRRLTTDGGYNAMLGSTHFSELVADMGGSYILPLIGYNAGPRRVRQWIERFGDPRKNNIDTVDWIETIPFTETRNYVMRVMENIQVYRYRLENAPLTLDRDIKRGKPGVF